MRISCIQQKIKKINIFSHLLIIDAKKAFYEMFTWKHGIKGTVKGTWDPKILGSEASVSVSISVLFGHQDPEKMKLHQLKPH